MVNIDNIRVLPTILSVYNMAMDLYMVYEAGPDTSISHTLCVNSTSDMYYGLNTNKYKISIFLYSLWGHV